MPNVVEEIYKQIFKSILYRCEKVPLENAYKFEIIGYDQKKEEFNIKDHYDYQQIYLKALLNSVSKESVKKI